MIGIMFHSFTIYDVAFENIHMLMQSAHLSTKDCSTLPGTSIVGSSYLPPKQLAGMYTTSLLSSGVMKIGP